MTLFPLARSARSLTASVAGAPAGALSIGHQPHLAFEAAFHAPPAVRHYWRNAGDNRGVFSTCHELRMVLSNVGSTANWDWIVCDTDLPGGRWTQAGGNITVGLVVEINGPHQVVPLGSPPWPRENIGTKSWSYLGSRDELHDLGAAATIQFSWLVDATVIAGLDLRTPDLDVRRHW